MTERNEVVVRPGLLGQLASSQAADAATRTVRTQPEHSEEAS
jgi:hypothetical protein